MGTIQSGTGISSGVNITQLVEALINSQKGTINRLASRAQGFATTQTGISTITANLLPLTSIATQLETTNSFEKRSVTSSDTKSLTVIANKDASFGTYSFQALKKSVAQQVTSQGFASETQLVGTGTITLAKGGNLDKRATLDILNGGEGVNRGSIRITDRSGSQTLVDLSNAVTLNDVINTINNTSQVAVKAEIVGDHLVLQDLTGQTTTALSVTDVNGGTTAAGLGLLTASVNGKLTGTDIFEISDQFQISQLNDGIGLRIKPTLDSLRIHLTDVAESKIDVSLDGAVTLKDIVDKINNDTDNGGKVLASVVDSRLVLTDLTAGGGPNALHVENLNDHSLVRELGLDAAPTGGTLTGNRLSGGLNSVLLRNLKGGAGITQKGQISLTDRAGTTATIDLGQAETLDDVLQAINGAKSVGDVKLTLQAKLNSAKTGIVITDTSGSTASNLIISDVGGSTVAADLGITVNAAQTSQSSGSLSQQYVGLNTNLNKLAKNGTFSTSGFMVTDSNSIGYMVSLTSATQTVGDLIDKINTATGGQVTAKLNSTGDGFELVDQAGGASALRVDEFGGGTSAADLKIRGTGTLGGDGKYHLSAREATTVTVSATDKLIDVMASLNNAGVGINASLINNGATLNPLQLSIRSKTNGTEGAFLIDQSGLDFNFNTSIAADDTVLRVGTKGQGDYLLTSSSTRFVNATAGITVDVLKASTDPVEITVNADNSVATTALTGFVSGYNKLLDSISELTKFDTTTNERGILQGNAIVFRVTQRLEQLVNRQSGPLDSPIRSLANLGVKVLAGGKLEIDTEQLEAAFAENPTEVTEFFTRASQGFGKDLTTAVKSFTDSIDGSLIAATNSLQSNIDFINTRIESLNEILARRKEMLTRKFIRMDTIVGQLTSSQASITQLANRASSS